VAVIKGSRLAMFTGMEAISLIGLWKICLRKRAVTDQFEFMNAKQEKEIMKTAKKKKKKEEEVY
jgi:hypothetical protein